MSDIAIREIVISNITITPSAATTGTIITAYIANQTIDRASVGSTAAVLVGAPQPQWRPRQFQGSNITLHVFPSALTIVGDKHGHVI
jgi:hypothetical protein